MSRLPTVGGDNNTWGTVLNDYLTETAVVATLASSPAAGATTFDLAVVPPGLQIGSFIAIDAYTTECELRSVSNLSGSTITVAALKYAHAAGDTLLVVRESVPVDVYGVFGDGSNEWGAVQRLLLEAVPLNLRILGGNKEISVQSPLSIQTGSVLDRLRLRSAAGFTSVDASGAMVTVGHSNWAVTADASNNRFTTGSAHGMSVDEPVVLFAPYGESLPSPIVNGKLYWVKTVPTTTTITVTNTFQGTEVDLLSDGAAYLLKQAGASLARVYWESVYVTLTIADLNGIRLNLQQPSWTRNLRIEMDANATSPGSAIGLKLDGQLSYHENMEINTSNNCTGLYVYGTGHIIRGFNCNGVASADTAITMGGQAHEVSNLWAEAMGRACFEQISTAGNNRGNVLSGACICTTNPVATIPIMLTDGAQFAMRGTIRHTNTGQMIYKDTATGIEMFGWDGLTPGSGESDTTNIYHGHEGNPPFPLVRLVKRVDDAAYTVARKDHPVIVNAQSGDVTITLPTAVNWRGWTTTIAAIEGGNNVIVDPAGAETIDGASTMTLGPGEAVTVCSDAANYRVLSRYVPTTLQTYAATNVSTDRAYDADSVVVAELADVVGTLIADLRAQKLIG